MNTSDRMPTHFRAVDTQRPSDVAQPSRRSFHKALIDRGILYLVRRHEPKDPLPSEFPSNADGDSATSVAIAQGIFDQIQSAPKIRWTNQLPGDGFEGITQCFIEKAFPSLKALCPAKAHLNSADLTIFGFQHLYQLANLSKAAGNAPEIAATLDSDYLITPDILVFREPEPDRIRTTEMLAEVVKLRSGNRQRSKVTIFHVSVSCKWTLRDDRAQNARSEALNLIRNRKGEAPHIAVVTAEPLPSRLASLALGTADIDCVYHFALPELIKTIKKLALEDSMYMVRFMVNAKKLKDIADLPVDLALKLTNWLSRTATA